MSGTTSTAEIVRLLTIATVLTLIVAAPVVVSPQARLFGWETDGYHPDAYIVVEQLEGAPQLHHFTQPATDWVGTVMARLVGGVPAYNLLILLTFPLAALFAFLLARNLGLGNWPAVFISLLYAFSPFHLAHAAYHPHITQIQWLPLYVLALWLCLDRWTLKRALLLAVATALLVLSNFYAGLIGAVITPITMAALYFARYQGDLRRGLRHLLSTAATLLAFAVAGALYAWRIGGSAVIGARQVRFPYEDLFDYCARWWSYLVPAVDHPVLGDFARGIWERHGIPSLVEQQVFLGWAVMVLASLAVLGYLVGRRFPPAPGLVPGLVGIALVAFAFSLPPEGRIGAVPRPTAILYDLLPMFRAHARFGLVVQLATLLLAAIGLSALWSSGKRNYKIIAGCLVAVALFEFAPLPPWRWHWVLPTEAHRWLDSQPGELQVVDCHEARPGEEYRLARMSHSTTLASSGIADCAEPSVAGKLSALGYTHMLLRPDFRLRDHLPEEGLERIEWFTDSRLYAVTAAPAPAYVGEFEGFSWRETKGERTFRWMAQEGALTVYQPGPEPVCTQLVLELGAFPQHREVTISLDAEELGRVMVPDEGEIFAFGPIDLAPGRHRLRLTATEPAVTPDSLLGNGDLRELAVSLWYWGWRPCPTQM